MDVTGDAGLTTTCWKGSKYGLEKLFTATVVFLTRSANQCCTPGPVSNMQVLRSSAWDDLTCVFATLSH